MVNQSDFFIICDNVRSTHNVGSIFRTSDAVKVSKIFLCGIAPVPPRPDIDKVSLGAEKIVPFEYRTSTLRLVKTLKSNGVKIVVLENNVPRAKDFRKINVRFPLALVVGSEVGGIPKKILELADEVIAIPMFGQKESLNVSVAFGIVAYEIIRQRKI